MVSYGDCISDIIVKSPVDVKWVLHCSAKLFIDEKHRIAILSFGDHFTLYRIADITIEFSCLDFVSFQSSYFPL